MIPLLLAALAWGGRTDVVTVPDRPLLEEPKTFAGPFNNAPVFQWRHRLPGKRVNASSHAERSAPVVVGEHILLGAAGGQALYVLSRHDGRQLSELPAAGSVEASPVVQGDTVWFTDTSGSTWCYRLDGTEVWHHQGASPLPTRPTVNDKAVFVRNVDDLVVALDKQTGELLWQYRRKKDPSRLSELTLYAAPPVVLAGNLALVGFSDGALVALDAASGDLRWDQRLGEGRYPDIVAPPTVDGAMAYPSAYLAPVVGLDLATNTVRWRVEAGAAASGTVIVIQDGRRLLLHPGTDGVLRAIDTLAGDVAWSWDSGKGAALTAPVPTPAGLMIGSSGGPLSLINPEDGTTLWTWHERFLLEGMTAAPVIAGRQMLFTTNAGYLYSMISPLDDAPWPPSTPPASRFKLVDRPHDGWQRNR